MTLDPTKLPIAQRYEHLVKVIAGERFLRMQGLGNEVPFYVCPYRPVDAVPMGKMIRQLVTRLENDGVRVLEIDLYDLSLDLLRARGILDRVLEIEPTIDKTKLRELLQNVLDPENHLVPAIAARMRPGEFDVLFITGVGEVFPFIRSHNVLNNLQKAAKDRPTVMFFPGDYVQSAEKGASLVLFNKLPGDKYYRAFNIYHIDVE